MRYIRDSQLEKKTHNARYSCGIFVKTKRWQKRGAFVVMATAGFHRLIDPPRSRSSTKPQSGRSASGHTPADEGASHRSSFTRLDIIGTKLLSRRRCTTYYHCGIQTLLSLSFSKERSIIERVTEFP